MYSGGGLFIRWHERAYMALCLARITKRLQQGQFFLSFFLSFFLPTVHFTKVQRQSQKLKLLFIKKATVVNP